MVQGNREVNAHLFTQKYDLIFFTGSPALARTVASAAAPNLTPLVLELGGKSPCIISRDADIALAAKRIAWGKTLNAGQTCIAPDFVLIHPDVKEAFVQAFDEAMRTLHGEDIRADKHYVRMVSDKAFDRVTGYLQEGSVRYGGHSDASERFIEPTLLDEVRADADVLTTEIFGPVLPIVTLDDPGRSFSDQVVDYVTRARSRWPSIISERNPKDGILCAALLQAAVASTTRSCTLPIRPCRSAVSAIPAWAAITAVRVSRPSPIGAPSWLLRRGWILRSAICPTSSSG